MEEKKYFLKYCFDNLSEKKINQLDEARVILEVEVTIKFSGRDMDNMQENAYEERLDGFFDARDVQKVTVECPECYEDLLIDDDKRIVGTIKNCFSATGHNKNYPNFMLEAFKCGCCGASFKLDLPVNEEFVPDDQKTK